MKFPVWPVGPVPYLSLPARGVWIEIAARDAGRSPAASLPARGVWIEMVRSAPKYLKGEVAPRKGSVD